MNPKSIIIEILESTPSYVKVKLPFVEVPIKMNYPFFLKRLKSGYFYPSGKLPLMVEKRLNEDG